MATIKDRVSKSALCCLAVNIITHGTDFWAYIPSYGVSNIFYRN